MMKENYKINKIGIEDINEMTSLVRSSFDSKYLIPSIYRGFGVDKFIAGEILNPFPNSFYYAFKHENKIVGIADLKPYDKIIFLNMICISSQNKGAGIGSAFLQKLLRYFKLQNYEEMHLDVFGTNDVALNWYLGQGFEIIGKKYFKVAKSGCLPTRRFNILNYPQVQSELELFGFSVLKIIDDQGIQAEIGRICQDFIIRSKVSRNLISIGNSLIDKFRGNKLYYFSDNEASDEASSHFDVLYRLKTKL